MTRQRFIWADSLKGWLMLLVIIGHAIQGVLGNACNANHVWNLIYSFHMPAFMAVSGYLSSKSSITSGGGRFVLLRRFRQLMIPYLVWSLIQFVQNGAYTLERLLKMITQPDSSFWFLWVLFFIFLFFSGGQLLAKKLTVDEFAIIIPLCVLLDGIMVGLDFRLFGFQFLAYYFMFYTLGYAIRRMPVLQIASPMYQWVLTAVWVILAWSWNMHTLPSWVPSIPYLPSTLVQYAYRSLTAVVATVVILSAAPKLLGGMDRLNKNMAHLGQLSLGLYVVHLTITGYVVSVIFYVWPTISVLALIPLTAIVVFLLSWMAVELLQKNKHTNKILLGKV